MSDFFLNFLPLSIYTDFGLTLMLKMALIQQLYTAQTAEIPLRRCDIFEGVANTPIR